jgi:hypothetical protein
MPPVPVSAPPVIRLTDRQEAFCQAMACNTGGAEAARRAGYSPNGAKQRGAFLMRQPEIRVRVEQLRTGRHATHQSLLDDAAIQVKAIIADALEKKSCGLALRAIEFRLKLHGVIQDKRIAHHYHLDPCHPDADLENLDLDAQEEFDAFLLTPGGKVAIAPTPQAPELPAPIPEAAAPEAAAAETSIVTPDDDLAATPDRAVPPRSLPAPKPAPKPTPKIVTRNSDLPRFRLPVPPPPDLIAAACRVGGRIAGRVDGSASAPARTPASAQFSG